MRKPTGSPTMTVNLILLLLHCAVAKTFTTTTKTSTLLPAFYHELQSATQQYVVTSDDVVPSGLIGKPGTITQTQYYTVKPQFVDLVNHIRSHGGKVHIKVIGKLDGSFSVVLTSGSKSKTFDNVNKATFKLFTTLLENPNLLITTVGKVGNDVKIAVAPEPPQPTNIIQVKPEFVKIIDALRKNGGAKIEVQPDNGKYTISISDDKGEKTYKDIPADIGKQFIRLAKDPDLEFQILSHSPTQDLIFVPDVSGNPTTFTVDPLFVDLVTQVRKSPDNEIQIKSGIDGKYVLILNGKTYKHIDPDLLYVFVKLIREPSLQFKISPAASGKLTIVLQPQAKTSQITHVSDQELLELLKKHGGDISFKLSIEEGPHGPQLLVTHNNVVKRYKLPKEFLKLILRIITSGKKPHSHYQLSWIEDDDRKPSSIEIDTQIVNLITEIKENPKKHYSFTVEPQDNGQYNLVILVDGKPKELHNVPPKAIQFLVDLSKDPKSPYHVIVDTKPSTGKPTHTLVVPSHETEPDKEIPTEQVQILQIVKASPQLIVNIVPQKDNKYTIILTDGTEVKKFPNVEPQLIYKIITLRNEKDLPIEIQPGEPGHVHVTVPTGDNPDTKQIDVDLSFLKPIHDIRHDPELQITVKPNDHGTFTVTLTNGKKEKPIQNVTSELLHLLIDLKTNPNPTFTIKSGKPGKITLVVPKTQRDPVTVKFTPEIIKLIIASRNKPEPTISVKPGKKPGTFTLVLDETPYPDIPAQLVPVIIRLSSQPNIDFEIKPGKDNTIQFVFSAPSPDSKRFRIQPGTLQIISVLRRNPKAPIDIKPGFKGTFTIEVTDDKGNKKTFPGITGDTLDLIIDLRSHPDKPFSVKPTPDGDIYILVPKPSGKDESVPLRPHVLLLIKAIRDNPDLHITIDPKPDNSVTVTLDNGKKTKEFPNIPLKVLPLIIDVYSKPHLTIPIHPTDDGQVQGKIPHETAGTTSAPVDTDDIELLHHIHRPNVVDVHLKRNEDDGTVDVTVERGPYAKFYPNVRPKIVNLVAKLFTLPKYPYHIHTGKDGETILTVPQRPTERPYNNVPKDTLKFIDENRNNPRLTLDVTKGDKPFTYDVVFKEGGKPVKRIPNVDPDAVQLLVLLYDEPDVEFRTKPDDKKPGHVTVIPSSHDITSVDVPLTPEQVHLVYDIRKPDVNNVDIVPSKDDKYTVVYNDNGKPKISSEIGPLLVNFIVRLRTEPSLPVKIFVTNDGQVVATIPKRVSQNVYPNVDVDVVNYLKTERPKHEHPTFSIKQDGDKPDSYTVTTQTKSSKRIFQHQPSTSVQLLVLLLTQPELHFRILNEAKGKATVHVTSHTPNVIFRNVRPSFLHLSQIVRHLPVVSVAIDRKPNNELNVGITNGKDTLNVQNVDPIIVELFVALFSRNNFPHRFYLDNNDLLSLVIRKNRLNPRFYDVEPRFFAFLKTLRHPQLLRVVINHDFTLTRYDVEIKTAGQKPRVFKNLRPQDVQLLTLFVTYFDLPFEEHRLPNEKLIVDVTISARLPLYDFALLTERSEVIRAPEPIPEPVFVPEFAVVPKIHLRPEIKLVPQIVAHAEVVPVAYRVGGFRQVVSNFKEITVEEKVTLDTDFDAGIRRRGSFFTGKYDESRYNEYSTVGSGSEAYYKNKRYGLSGGHGGSRRQGVSGGIHGGKGLGGGSHESHGRREQFGGRYFVRGNAQPKIIPV